MAEAARLWHLSDEEKSRHITVFYGLNPENGVLLGDRCRELFSQSKLSAEDLSHIWRISDVDGDGALNVGEFTVAMHLINAKLSGRELPKGLPPSIRPCVDKSIPGVTTKDYETYVKAFHELDKNQTGSLTAEEAKPIFIKSQLLTGHLAHVWNLADYDHDGNLSVNEFVLATHLMRFLKSGNQLPSIMDVKVLLPEHIRQEVITPPSTPTKDNSYAENVDSAAHNEEDMRKSKASIHRGKWMTFSSKKSCGMFTAGENRKPVDSKTAFSPTLEVSLEESLSNENPFETDIFVPVDYQPRRVSVTSLESTTSIEPFEEDPFKNCDPFSSSFSTITEDPFETSAPDVFNTGAADPFADTSGSLDPFTESSDLFASSHVVDVQSSHLPSAGDSQIGMGKGELASKFESTFGEDDGFLDQKTMSSSEKDPFIPAGTELKLLEAPGNEDPFGGDSFVQCQSGLEENSEPPFSSSLGAGVPGSRVQLDHRHSGNQDIDPFGVAMSADNPFEIDHFEVVVNKSGHSDNSFESDPFEVAISENGQPKKQSADDPFESDPFGIIVSDKGHSENQSADSPFGNDTFQPTILANASNSFPLVNDPFAASTTTATKESSNPFELDKFVPEQNHADEQVTDGPKSDNAQLTELTTDSCEQDMAADRAQKVNVTVENEKISHHHVKFPEDSTMVTTFETYGSDEYIRKDAEVDPQRAELEVIRDEHRSIKHGLDDVEHHLLRRLSSEIEEERTDPSQQHVKFNENIGTIPTFSSDEYDRKDSTIDPEKATEEVCKETGMKKLTPQDSVSNLRAKQAKQERRQKQVALQQQLIAEIDLEWEEKERSIELEIEEAKEEAKRKFLADTEATQKLEHERWQQKLKEKEEEQKKAEQDELERQEQILAEAEKKAIEDKSTTEETEKTEEKEIQIERQIEEEIQSQEQEDKRGQEGTVVEVQASEEQQKEAAKTQAKEEEDKAIAEPKKTQEVNEIKAEAEQNEAPKARKGLAAHWEAVASGQMKERSPPQDHTEVLDRIKREEEEMRRRQQEHEEETLKRAEDAARRREQQKKEAIEKHKQKQLEEEEQWQREQQRKEKEEKEKQMKKSSSQPKPKKHALAKQWEEKFSK